ncbi:MAG: hypothetical protein QNI99_12075 [Woeseiaceae bacterium]|nr:hypothetical protein [Woeseiaceae bacterium]
MSGPTSGTIYRSWMLGCVAVMLLGCEVGEEEEPEPERCFETSLANCGAGPWDPFGIALAFAWWSGQCTEEVACTADPPSTDLTNGLVTNDYIRSNWLINNATEREPNDSFDEAMPFLIENDGSFTITGTVNSVDDEADFIIFTTESFDLHAVYLCRSVDECLLPFYQGSDLYLEFYDQERTLLESTGIAQTPNGHEVVFTPSPGLRYYVAVRAGNTGGEDRDYKVAITD